MKAYLILAAMLTSALASAAPRLSSEMDALYQQMEPVRRSLDKKKLEQVRAIANNLNNKAGEGRADTGCFDASGMLRAMPVNIELQWEASTQEQAKRHQAYWQELNTKYQKYAAQCAASNG